MDTNARVHTLWAESVTVVTGLEPRSNQIIRREKEHTTKDALLKKIEAASDEAQHQRLYGNIEIEVRDGQPNFVRGTLTEKIAQENTRGSHNFQR